MARSEGLRRIALTPAHTARALALSVEAGWNQNADDWRMLIGRGGGIGVEDENGRLAATALTLPYPDGGFGWISMVLVTAAWRRGGLASRLLEACVERLSKQDLIPVLDATPAGELVYRPLGFMPSFATVRLHCAAPRPAPAATIETRPIDDPGSVADLDRAVFGADRGFVLAELFSRAPALSAPGGYAFGRDGRTARYIGPMTAPDSGTAIALVSAMLAAMGPGPVLIDVPTAQSDFRAWLEASGVAAQRPYPRMILGRPNPFGDPARTFAIAGPELG